MKEQWTQDLKDKLCDYEAPVMPEGLWDDIEKEISPKTSMPFFSRWQRVCAAVVILLISASGIWFMMDSDEKDTPLAITDGCSMPDKIEITHHTDAETSSVGSIKSLIASAISSYTVDSTLVADASNCVSSQEETTTANHSSQESSQPETSQDTPQPETVSDKPTRTSHDNRSMEYFVPESHSSDNKAEDNIYLAVNASGIVASGTNFSLGGASVDNTIYETPVDSVEATLTSRSRTYIDSEHHHRPVSVGMQVGIPLSKRWSLNTGLTYTYLYSEFDKGFENHYTHTDQKIHYLGVPVMFNYRLYSGSIVNLYLGLGGRFDVGVSGTSTAHDIINDNEASVSSERLSGMPCNILPTITSGIQINIIKGLSVYAEPSLMRTIQTSRKYSTYYSEHNLMFDVHFGLRWDLSK